MQYLAMIYVDETAPADYSKTSPEYEEYNRQLSDAGVRKGGVRLGHSSTATTVRVRDGEELFTDGPFAEAREQLGGYFLFECENLDEALKWAAQCPGAQHGAVEVRPLAY
ncbi:YciI family protein [Amycolatopsis alkalitolerans]|uniref:YciI family protein n=1 Tax=Amycolatopsis alkalitolerans TaxID=2547244 RepID=A0A5C4LVU1_9PSEU|nr:YciI family protein [Amycolatopsis alkalitolerans]TNC23216.1 YciI family protein [Amycolatopsis alkalitolerans]